MGEDLSTGIKMAIILVILAALLASVFSILTITKNITTQSVDELQSSLYAFQNMRWEDYNLRTISGNEVQVVVRSAVENNIAVVVNTARNNTESVLYGVPLKGFKDGSENFGIYSGGTGNATTVRINETVTSGDIYYNAKSSYFVGSVKEKSTNSQDTKDYVDERYSYVRNITDSGSMYYINPSLKFDSYIIRDESGSLLGILFDQK